MNFARRASCCYLIKITPPRLAKGLVYGFILLLLNGNRPVRANNLTITRRVVFPTIAFRYGVPLLGRSVELDALKPLATIEGIRADAFYTVGDCHAFKPAATIEGRISNA